MCREMLFMRCAWFYSAVDVGSELVTYLLWHLNLVTKGYSWQHLVSIDSWPHQIVSIPAMALGLSKRVSIEVLAVAVSSTTTSVPFIHVK